MNREERCGAYQLLLNVEQLRWICAHDTSDRIRTLSREMRNAYQERRHAWSHDSRITSNTSRLIELLGGRDRFVEELTTFFERGQPWKSTLLPNPYYWPGNEHDLFSVWQFNYANRSDLTQKYARWLLNHAYTAQPDGLPGNDDYGTMSAWYLFTSLGFYPLSGSSTYLLGSPTFDRITIHRNQGECTLTINVKNNSPTNVYVERVLLNGEPLATFPFIDHIEHFNCGKANSSVVQLDLFMSSTPGLSLNRK